MANTKSKKTVPHRTKRLPKGPHGIELLLVQPIEHLGKQGDVVQVKPGYAKNYLLPQGLATLATEHHKRMVQKHRAQLEAIEKARLVGLQSLAADLARQSITIEANANDEGHLYGSVGATEVANALKKANFHIAADQVRLKGPLKELGLYTVAIHLGQEVDAEAKIWVVPSVSEEGAKLTALPAPSLHIVLYQPEIPDNTGNIGRTCVALGAKLWLVRPLGFRLDDRHLRRAGLDYWEHLDWEAVDDWPSLVARIPGCQPWLLTKHATRPYTDAHFALGDVLVFGSESQGLPQSLLKSHARRCLRIPIAAEARSLNLAVSVAVAAFEARRQFMATAGSIS